MKQVGALKVITFAEMVDKADTRRKLVLSGRARWGRWRYHPRDLTIEHEDGYWYTLTRMRDSATVLDFIAQVAKKKIRFTPADVGDLVRMLNELIDLQGRVCGCGRDSHVDVRAFLKPKRVRKV